MVQSNRLGIILQLWILHATVNSWILVVTADNDTQSTSTPLMSTTPTQNSQQTTDAAVTSETTNPSTPPSTNTSKVTTPTSITFTTSIPTTATTLRPDCGAPLPIENSDYSPKNKTMYGDEVTYTCHPGYDQHGQVKMQCNANGNWESTEFNCTPKDCGTPAPIGNSDYLPKNKTMFGDEVTYTCHPGYNADGQDKIQCEANGNWTSTDFICSRKDCGATSPIENSDYSPKNKTMYGDEVTYTCNSGYDPHGQVKIQCDANGNWESTEFNCTPKDCSTPSPIENSDYLPKNKTMFGDEVTYTCHPGYNAEGQDKIQCEANGNWESTGFNCILKNCSTPSPIENSDYLPKNKTMFGDEVTYTCHPGYNAEGQDKIQCEANGNWESTGFNCILKSTELGKPCDIDDECKTNYTVCNTTCRCKETYFPKDGECIERPIINGKVDVKFIEITSYSIDWSALTHNYDSVKFNISSADGTYNLSKEQSSSDGLYSVISRAKSGTEYIVEFKIYKDDVPSLETRILRFHTKPEPVSSLTFSDRWETNLTVSWQYEEDKNCDYYILTIHPSPSTLNNTLIVERNKIDTSMTFQYLEGGTKYSVTITAVAGNFEANTTTDTYTRPIPVFSASILEQTDSTLNVTVEYNGANSDMIHYRIDIDPPLDGYNSCSDAEGDNTLSIQCANTSSFIVDNLIDGTFYNLRIFSWFEGLRAEHSYLLQNYTRPKRPNQPSIQDKTSSGFTVTLSGNGNFDLYHVQLCQSSDNTCPDEMITNETMYVVSNLTSGTNYTVTVKTRLYNGLESLHEMSTSSFTRPNGLISIDIPDEKVHEKNVTIDITRPTDGVYDHLVVMLYSNNGDFVKTFKNIITITELAAGTLYKVEVFTATVTNLTSSINITREFHTRPATPSVATPTERDLDYITFDLNGNTGTFDHFEITYVNGTAIENVTNDGDKQFKSTGLTAGTQYTYKVFTNFLGLRSDGYFLITAYTKPEQINDMKITHITSDAITIEWKAPSVGIATSYLSKMFCLGPNDDSEVKLFSNTSSTLIAITTGLEPGSICNASVTTQINDDSMIIQGETVTDILMNRTIEQGPHEVQAVSEIHTTSQSITIEWERPSVRNGIITGYVINVMQNSSKIQSQTLNCTPCSITNTDNDLQTIAKTCANATACDNAISDKRFRYNIPGLHPFRTYEVSVVAKTSKNGISKNVSYSTDESVPNGPPDVINNSTTATEITLTWIPPIYGERNGIITKYNISYSFLQRTCSDDVGEHVTQSEVLNDNSTSRTLTGLDPYTDHNVQIQAFTSIGVGPFSEAVTISTKQSKPSEVRELKVSTTTNESISLSWFQPCRTNGEINEYKVYLTNTDKHTQTSFTSVDKQIDIEDNILPYSNYSITVTGNTIMGEGNVTKEVIVRTDVGVPKIPQNVGAKNVSSTALNITWTRPKLYTGPTHYNVVVTDSVNTSQQIPPQHVTGFWAQTATIHHLDEYWLYSVEVIAETDAGKAKSSSIVIRTDEDVPEEVKGLDVTPEADVTKPRTIKVKWNLLTAREQNGILKGYTVRYGIQNGSETNNTLHKTESEYVIKNVNPGQYTIKVSASTSKGYGKYSSQSATLKAGAPIKVEETPSDPLIRPASIAVNDDETQIAIELPLTTFLCTTSNGQPNEWGVIVAEDSVASDKPFFGSKADYDSRKNSTYKRWVEVKDKTPMPAYIATKPGVYNPCQGSTRKKRSASKSSGGSFTVGADGKCSGVAGYCNGELPPGRSFRVKSYVCTSGGCTETMYSKPIRTAPDPTIPIAAGVTSAVLVIVLVIIIVALLKRKQLACFKKDVESTSTHVPADGIEFDRIESTRKRPFTPGQIKLVDFPERVDVMHKDSDLVFADAFKLLRERSPTHPMTAAEAQCSRPKNRYTNILPFDHSRVKLRPSDDVDGSDYINANYIPGYTSRREYIATQGPMPATFDDFWRMVWEQNVDTIVMLTKLMENGRHKCDKYWPDISEPVYYGDLVVTVSSESNLSDYTIRIIEVKSKNVSRKVQQFSYLKWPDMGSPETPDLLLEFVKNVRNYTKQKQNKSEGPTIVHCSAGVGRTGTFIAVDTLLQHIRDHDEVDIFDLVLGMRNHRLNMVQTEDQYVYIHECIKSFISTDEDDLDDDEEPVYMNTLQSEDNVYENTAYNAEL